MSAGKGDKPRPVNKTRYDENFDSINWKSKAGDKPAQGGMIRRSAVGGDAADQSRKSGMQRQEPSQTRA